ncbi:midasin [Pleuronectes platessa]|uniref:midasin n=1 Tax=Pleuronectes platessa TaxID=8262 RepID=UPI00232A3788|nr:midasin [Pleuronectes platessa]
MEVTFCSLDGERCQECRSPVDPGLLKVLQLAQLSVEWLLHCQEVLSLNLHACPICKKGFFTPQFLNSHMERRHPEDHESQLQSDREMKSQINNLKMEISGLRERNVQLQQNLDLKTAQEKRLESELDHFKAEEMARFERVQTDSARSQEQLLLKLEQQLKEQDESWKSILHQTKEHHDSEMNKMVNIPSNTKEVEEPVVVCALAPEPKPSRVVLDSSSASELEQSSSMMNLSGVKSKDFTFFMAKVNSLEDQAKEVPGYWRCRGELDLSLDEKMSARMMTEAPPEPQAPSGQAVQGKESKTPQPAPRAESTTKRVPTMGFLVWSTFLLFLLQVEDTFQEGQEKEEQQDKEKIKAEDNAIEMSEDFDGQMHDGDEKEPGEDEDSAKEDQEDLDKKMGNLGEGETDTLDERMWGDDEDDDEEEEEESDQEEESGQGMDQGESELVAKDDNLDAEEPNKDKKNQDKDEQMVEEEKEKIHEQGDEREFDENEVDPYHGQQDKRPEAEAMDLPEDLNLDQDEEPGEDGEGKGDEENPLDIDEKAMDLDEKEDGEKDGGEDEGAEEMQEEQTDLPGEEKEKEQEPKTEEEEGEGEKKGVDEESAAQDEEEEEKEKSGQEAGRDEDHTVRDDKGDKPKDEEEEAGDEEPPESAERKEHDRDGQTGEENVQSDTAVELGGEASEKDQAKEEHGSGAADASQADGHQSKLTARMAAQTQTQSKTQSFKRKPGHADNERSTGDYNEQINKRLRTVESSKDRSADNRPSDAQQDSELYEHIKQGERAYDTQTYDVASADQQKAAGPQQDQDQKDEDVAMETEDQEEDLRAADVQELKPEQLDSTKASQKGVDSGEMDVQRQGEEEEDQERWKDRQRLAEDRRAERSTESTIHTIPELLMDTMEKAERDPEEIRREMELQLEAWHKLAPGAQEEESAAASMWHQYQTLTSALSQQLCEQLRLILEPTQAAKLKGDYRTGKRLNMRKVIPYIASQFRKDKIWLRRTKPSKREYHVCLAVDDSSSMVDNHSKQLAFESLSVIINALTLLEVGQVSVCSFGEQVQLLHPFQQQFNDESGARILRLCQFQQKKTRIAQFMETSTKMFLAARQQIPGSVNSDTAQLLVIVSDGRGLFLEGKERVTAAVRAARSANVFVIFVVLDNPNSRDSILDIKVPIFKGPGELPEIRTYMEEFPFPFYVILRDVNALPETLSDALRQWFELVTAADQ